MDVRHELACVMRCPLPSAVVAKFRAKYHKARHVVRCDGCKRGAGVYKLEVETADDMWEVEGLYDTCFAPGREALSSYRLRDGVLKVPELCLVARDALGIVSAAIRYWPIHIGADKTVSLLLGPIAVHPTRQGEGLGGLLMQDSMERARALGWERVMLVGDAPYYRRFGFELLRDVKMPPPTNPERVLGAALVEGAWDGVHGVVERAI
jgi:predicted N-acetyltransferase YhbS